jgi:hypothetical protein
MDEELKALGRRTEAIRDRLKADLAELDAMERRMAHMSRLLDGETVQ